MKKRSHCDRSKNRSRKQSNTAALMALCIMGGLISVVLGTMSHRPSVMGIGGLTAGLGLSLSYRHYQSLNQGSSKRQ